MDESRHPRVQAHAAVWLCLTSSCSARSLMWLSDQAAVINFAEHCSSEILQQHADALVSKLYNLLRRPQRIIQEQVRHSAARRLYLTNGRQAMTAIASVAECISVSFAKFYEHFVPLLKYAIANAHGQERQSGSVSPG